MRKMNAKFVTQFISEAGAKLQNKDYFAFVELDHYAIYVIADGIDEDTDFESAQIAVMSMISNFTQVPSLKKKSIKKLLKQANEDLHRESHNVRLKCSVTLVVTDYTSIRYAVIGNTRFALYRDGFWKYQSQDQSLTQELFEKEQVAQDKIAQHQERNNLYCYLGQDEELTPFISEKLKLKDGDIMTLVTKGMWENIDQGEMLDSLTEAKDPTEVNDTLEEMLLSKQPEDFDNYTLATIFVDKIYINPKKNKQIKKVILTLIPIIILLIILSLVFYFTHQNKKQQRQEMEDYIQSAKHYIEQSNLIRANEEYKSALTLSKKLNLKEEKANINRQYQLTESIIEADKQLQEQNYSEAMDGYLKAKADAYYSDHLGMAYIDKKLDKTSQYIQIQDLLKEGDMSLELGDIPAAIASYKEAQKAAAKLFDKEGKKEAEAKLEVVQQIKAEEQKAQKEEAKAGEEKAKAEAEEEKVKEEEEKVKQEEVAKAEKEKLDVQFNAMEMTKKGNTSYQIGSYEDAKMYYTMAQELYNQIELLHFSEDIQNKIQLVEKKMNEQIKQKAKADVYVQDAGVKFTEGKREEAEMLYLFAKDIYEAIGLGEEVEKVDTKLAVIDALK